MPRARNPNRDKARLIYLRSSGQKALVNIAKELGVSPSEVRKWKSLDKWADDLLTESKKQPRERKKRVPKTEGNAPNEKGSVPKRKGGAPKGNKFALGNKGGGAPLRSHNARKHGGYAKIFLDTLDDEEKMLMMTSDIDEEIVLVETITLFSIRERRIMRAINQYKNDPKYKDGLYVAGVESRKTKRVFEGTPEEQEEERERYREKRRLLEEATPDILPGSAMEISTRTESTANLIARLERELTSVQSQKARALASLNQVRNARIQQEMQLQKLPLELELMDANIERTDALTNKILGSNEILEDLSETDAMLYGEDGDADEETC